MNIVFSILMLAFGFGAAVHAEQHMAMENSADGIKTTVVENGDPDQPIVTGSIPTIDKATPKLQDLSGSGKGALDDDDDSVSHDSEEEDHEDDAMHRSHDADEDELRGNAVSVEAREIRGWDSEKKEDFLATVKEHAEVRSEQDLENFAKGVLIRDDHVEAVEVEEEGVQVDYRVPAKFLGIFDAGLSAHVDVDTQGRVKVNYPWYGFLFQKLSRAADLQTKVEDKISELGDGSITGFTHRAEALERIIAALSGE